ncbi:scarecrow-like protein 8 [Mangifera indica]|uniref:scarecrow-like protein 8 n=1 Tax=Mangifera indica TaxID=29780 RepID=UPI001CFBBE4D|nr:scarecrow-like protein 8 [Mangifera indica]
MSSEFPGGGPDLYGGGAGLAGRSINGNASQPSYRSQLPGIFMDSATQIANTTAQNLIGKRTFTDFQTQQQLQQNTLNNSTLNTMFQRLVKPRPFQNLSPISPLSPVDFSLNNFVSSDFHRCSLPLLQQQLRPHQQQQQQLAVGLVSSGSKVQQLTSNLPYVNSINNNHNTVQNRVQAQDSEKKMLNCLQQLEKQLLDDNDYEEGDAASVITNTNSEWSETIQNLISPKSISPISSKSSASPTSSSTSSSSLASPVSNCSKQTVTEAALAISEGKNDVAVEILTRLSQVSNSKGNSEQRLMEYMCSALKSRVNPVENPPPVRELFCMEHVKATQLLYDHSPCFKLGFMAANLAIIEATLDQPTSNKFHVIDFDIGQGARYQNLLHALSTRSQIGNPCIVKITAVVENGCEESLNVVGNKLKQYAEKVGVGLNFNVKTLKLGDLTRDSLGCEPDEPVAVNFAFKLFRILDESVSMENPRDELLRQVKGLSPRVVTLVEQDMNSNTAPFLARVNEACAYYGALFDSIDSTVPRDSLDRLKVEEGLGRKLINSVACEGRDRVERCEVFGKWRARMTMAGFELKPMSSNIAESMRSWLSSHRVNPGFTVKEENGGVRFGWMSRNLTVASAWR